MNTPKKSCGRCGLIMRSIQPNRAVVAAQSCGRFFCIDLSMRRHRAVAFRKD